MSESAFLTAVESYLGTAGLTPAPTLLGVAEPADTGDLPAVVLSLESLERPRTGLGERTSLMTGALPQQAVIDLADPTLPGTAITLVADGRRTLTLPHGGLVRSDGSEGPLGPGDLTVAVAGAPRTVVPAGEPGADEVRAVPASGQLRFGQPLPAAGEVEVGYFVGQWEQRVRRVAGTLRVDACAGSAADASSLSRSVLDALEGRAARDALPVLLHLSVRDVGAIEVEPLAQPGGDADQCRRRTHRLAFAWERVLDEAESSGGVIHRVQVDSDVDGADQERMVVE